MKTFLNYLIIFAIVPALVLTACKKEENNDPVDTTPAFETLKDYVTANGMDITDVVKDWIVSAEAVHNNMDNYYIMDIRQADAFNTGHIAGAVNVAYKDVVTEATANAGGKPIIIVCYTGQTAGHAVVALRMSGFEAQVMKFGMSSWHTDFANPWLNNTGDVAVGHANWAAAPGDIAATVDFNNQPEISTTATDGAAILAEQVGKLLNDGTLRGVNNTDVLDAPTNYYINNFWGVEDVEHYGNIKSAYRIKPLSFKDDTWKGMDASKTVVTYCWTGQTSSMITAYLTVMGYDAKSLKFGSNGMIYSELESHKFSEGAIMGYDYVAE